MELNDVKNAFDQVVNRHDMYKSRIQALVDQITQQVENALVRLPTANPNSILHELELNLETIVPLSLVETAGSEVDGAASHYLGLLKEFFVSPHASENLSNIGLDTHTVNQIVATHLYQQCCVDLAERFLAEATTREPSNPSASCMDPPFLELYQIRARLREKDLSLALSWTLFNEDRLKEIVSDTDMVLKLHYFHFNGLLIMGKVGHAVAYANSVIIPRGSEHVDKVQKFLDCALDHSPYSHSLHFPATMDQILYDLTLAFLQVVQSPVSPLTVAIGAGVQVLSDSYQKIIQNTAGTRKDDELLVELDDEFKFHSIFVCPVSGQQATTDNRPVRLPCGHVLCTRSIQRMQLPGYSRSVKCPVCEFVVYADKDEDYELQTIYLSV